MSNENLTNTVLDGLTKTTEESDYVSSVLQLKSNELIPFGLDWKVVGVPVGMSAFSRHRSNISPDDLLSRYVDFVKSYKDKAPGDENYDAIVTKAFIDTL